MLLSFAFTLNLAFEARAEAWLHDAFVVRNSLASASEILIRAPIAAVVLSLVGCLSNAWITARSRGLAVVAAWLTPLVFVAGALARWYANSLERAARPPFILGGLMAAAIALCAAHPIWSAITGESCRPAT
jgi:hypothetical protein